MRSQWSVYPIDAIQRLLVTLFRSAASRPRKYYASTFSTRSESFVGDGRSHSSNSSRC